jgi:hypothetical protein
VVPSDSVAVLGVPSDSVAVFGVPSDSVAVFGGFLDLTRDSSSDISIIAWCWGLVLGSGVGVWCWGLVLRSGVGVWCWGLVLGSGVGVWCWGLVLGSGVLRLHEAGQLLGPVWLAGTQNALGVRLALAWEDCEY